MSCLVYKIAVRPELVEGQVNYVLPFVVRQAHHERLAGGL